MTQTDVLVVGAGPTGLTLACDLARRGAAVRIIDRAPQFPDGSRGKGLSPRSLEVLDDLAVIDPILASGVTHLPHRKYRGAEVIAETDPEAGRVPTPDIPYPVGLMIPQWRVEQILRERLAGFGVAVELGAGLRGFSQHADGVTATIGEARLQARYLVGCDGGRSTVRKALGLSLRGQTPDVQLMAVGDVEVDGLGRDAWHQWFAGGGAIMLCPLPGTNAFQVQASHELGRDGSPLEPTLERFQQTFDRVAGVPGVRLHDLAWRSTYRVQVRMVDRLRADRVFLAGDAAHVHPIAGGLGMNSGIQDACNLGWKLGLVLASHATPGLLDTYEEERLPIASWLLDITSEVLNVVHSAASGLGTAGMQLAKAAGAKVIAVAGGAEKTARCAALGADLVIDHTTEDFVEVVLTATGDAGADVIYDLAGGDFAERSWRCTAHGGRYLAVGFADDAANGMTGRPLRMACIGNIDIVGVMLAWVTAVDPGMRRFGFNPFGRDIADEIHADLLRLAADGKIRPVIGRRVAMGEAGPALDEHEARRAIGRTVVLVT